MTRIFKMKLYKHVPCVYRLEVHLEGAEMLVFRVLLLSISCAGGRLHGPGRRRRRCRRGRRPGHAGEQDEAEGVEARRLLPSVHQGRSVARRRHGGRGGRRFAGRRIFGQRGGSVGGFRGAVTADVALRGLAIHLRLDGQEVGAAQAHASGAASGVRESGQPGVLLPATAVAPSTRPHLVRARSHRRRCLPYSRRV